MKYYFTNLSGKSMTIYYFLKSLKLSESTIVRLRKKLGYLKINNIPKTTIDKIENNQILKIDYCESISNSFPAIQIDFKIVYEDEYYLIVDKPANITTIPTHAHFEDSLANAVLFYQNTSNQNFTFRALNRLDLGTSGLVIIAKDIISANLFHSKSNPKKNYLALVEGNLDKFGTINKNIIDNRIEKKQNVSESEGKNAITHYKLCKYIENINCSLIELTLENGRTNQIRVHCSSIGHPLLGDIKYNCKNLKYNHFYLRCYKLTFLHPIFNKIINIELEPMLPNFLN